MVSSLAMRVVLGVVLLAGQIVLSYEGLESEVLFNFSAGVLF